MAAAKSKSGLTIKNRIIYRDGVKVGSLDLKGNFQIVDPEGKQHSGNVGALIRDEVKAKLLSGGRDGLTGRVRVGIQTYEVRGGHIFFEGKSVGTLSNDGDYEFTLFGKTSAGNVTSTIGAVWVPPETPDGASGKIAVGPGSFTALKGVVFEGGEPIGWLLPDGRFRGVTIEGDHFEGSLGAINDALYFRFVE